jgi:hypothetical protein
LKGFYNVAGDITNILSKHILCNDDPSIGQMRLRRSMCGKAMLFRDRPTIPRGSAAVSPAAAKIGGTAAKEFNDLLEKH